MQKCKLIIKVSFSILIIFPGGVIKWTDTPLFEPSSDAVMVEGVIADSPGDDAFFGRLLVLIGLTIYTRLHYMALADGTVFDFDIPGPQGNRGPLFDFESFNMLLRIFLFHILIILKCLN